MNWHKVNLSDGYERDQNILDGYSFDTLLLEITCNLKEINRETVREQFMESLNNNIHSAREIFESNLDAIVEKAIAERNKLSNSLTIKTKSNGYYKNEYLWNSKVSKKRSQNSVYTLAGRGRYG